MQRTVPPERLLVFDVRQGWEPLCAFLGVPVPLDEPFPHVNDAGSFQRQLREQTIVGVLRIAALVGGAAAALAVARVSRQYWLPSTRG